MSDFPNMGGGAEPKKNSAYFGLNETVVMIIGLVIIFGYIIYSQFGNIINSDIPVDTDLLFFAGTIAGGTFGGITLLISIILWIIYSGRGSSRNKSFFDSKLLLIKIPKENEILPDAAEAVYNSLYSVYEEYGKFSTKLETSFSFEIVSRNGNINFYAFVDTNHAELLMRQIYSQYPDVDINEVEDYELFAEKTNVSFTELVQTKEPAHPIKSYRDLAKEAGTGQLKEISVDTLSAITNAIGKLEDDETAAIQVLFKPTGDKWQKTAEGIIDTIQEKTKPNSKGESKQLTQGDQEKIRTIESNVSKHGFETMIRIVTTSPVKSSAIINLKHIIAGFQQFNMVEHNSFAQKKKVSEKHFFNAYVHRFFPLFTWKPKPYLLFINPILSKYGGQPMVFNGELLASIYHYPNKGISTPQIDWLKAKRAPAPQNTPGIPGKKSGLVVKETSKEYSNPGYSLLGYNIYRGVRKEVTIKREDRRRHVYSIGRTGMGKSVFMENQIFQDIVNGEGVCVVDPHGELARKCLEFVPKERIDDVIYFDPSDIERPMGLNMLEANTPEEKDFAVAEFIQILYKLFKDFIGPRFEHIVRNSLLAIMEHPDGGTLVEMMRILTDDDYRDECVSHVTNPLVKAFWQEEMAQQVQFHKSEMLGPVLSKFGRFVSNNLMRNIIGQTKSAFNFREVMDKRKILLINLSKGKIGDINSNLLGMIIVGKLLMAALSRTDMPEEERHDFYLYVDEFQNFATDTFATILSEARKYRLSLNVTHQYVGQLQEDIQKAIFGNVGTLINFRIGAPDAEIIGKEVKPTFEEADILNLQKYTAYCKLLVDGMSTKPFSMHTYPPVNADSKIFVPRIVQMSRLKYGVSKEFVDADIERRGRFDLLK